MKKHKWEDLHNESDRHKMQKCTKCDCTRYWIGGRWQMWEYSHNEITTFKRPECK